MFKIIIYFSWVSTKIKFWHLEFQKLVLIIKCPKLTFCLEFICPKLTISLELQIYLETEHVHTTSSVSAASVTAGSSLAFFPLCNTHNITIHDTRSQVTHLRALCTNNWTSVSAFPKPTSPTQLWRSHNFRIHCVHV